MTPAHCSLDGPTVIHRQTSRNSPLWLTCNQSHTLVASLMSLMASLVTTSRIQQCLNVLIDIYHEFRFFFVLLFCSVGNKTYYYYFWFSQNYSMHYFDGITYGSAWCKAEVQFDPSQRYRAGRLETSRSTSRNEDSPECEDLRWLPRWHSSYNIRESRYQGQGQVITSHSTCGM